MVDCVPSGLKRFGHDGHNATGLQRMMGGRKINIPVEFPLTGLDITAYMATAADKPRPYDLVRASFCLTDVVRSTRFYPWSSCAFSVETELSFTRYPVSIISELYLVDTTPPLVAV